jgi:hypothetical protein
MAAISSTEVALPYKAEGTTPQLTTITFTAYSGSGRDTVPVPTNGMLLLVQNANVSGAKTVTIYSTADGYGRTADITAFSIPANTIVARKFTPRGWENALGSGLIEVAGEDTDVKFAVIPL